MKRVLYILILILISVFANAQIPADSSYPTRQALGKTATTIVETNTIKANDGFVMAAFADTTTANLFSYGGKIKYYPGAVIFTTDSNMLWVRNSVATRWLQSGGGSSGGNITSFTMYTDSSIIICYSNGSCDTIPFNNFTEIINNIIQNFTDSSIYNLNDSTLIICNEAGSCDTIDLRNSNNYYFINDSTLVTCDTLETICGGTNGDSCYTQQICDTIVVPRLLRLQFQNGHYQFNGSHIVEAYDVGGNQAQLLHNSILNTYAYNLTYTGQPINHEPFGVKQGQIVNLSSSVQSFHHVGGNKYTYPNMIDNDNEVRLYVNYTDRFFTGVSAPFTGDTIGFMYDRIGYMLMGNSRGGSTAYAIDNVSSKQSGLMIHTLDTQYTDAVTIFGRQTPSAFAFSVNPYPTTTLLDSRIAVFKTTGQVQLPQYIEGAFEEPSPLYIIAQDSEGNLVQYPPGGVSTGLLIDADNGLSVRSSTVAVLGQNEAEVGNPAILLSNREIPMGGFLLSLNASATQAVNILQTKNAAAAIRARVTSAASFSNTGGQAGSEIFGDGAAVSGQNSFVAGNASSGSAQDVVIGNSASSSGGGARVVIGKSSSSSTSNPGEVIIGAAAMSTGVAGGSNIVIGTSATTSGSGVVGVGYASSVSGTNSTGVGNQVNINSSHQYSIALGTLATTTGVNQFVVGASGGGAEGANHYYLGNGVVKASGGTIADIDIQPTGQSGTDQTGVNFYLAASKGTGAGSSGDLKHQTSVPVASGTTLQTLGDRYSIVGKYTTLTESSATSFVRVNVPSNTVAGGEIIVTVEANDGTEFQARTLTFAWSAANKAGTTDADISTPVEVVSISSGTLTVTITVVDAGSGNIDFKADATSSLTQTVLRANCQVLKNFGTGAITAQ